MGEAQVGAGVDAELVRGREGETRRLRTLSSLAARVKELRIRPRFVASIRPEIAAATRLLALGNRLPA